MSIKELLFSLKYKREGDAYLYWKIGLMARVGVNGKTYPNKPEDASPELFEKKKGVKVPDWLKDDYTKKIENRFKRKEE